MKINIIYSSLAAVLLGLSGQVIADSSEINLSEFAKKSAMVFEGTVEKIEYASHAGPYEDDGQMPYTYVTYRVNKVLMGNSENNDRITLRYEGGLNDDGTFMLASHTPLFDQGDTDILFVSNNKLVDCPLVDCKQSRIRIINDKAYTNGGRQLILTKNNTIRSGIEEKLTAVFQNRIGEFEVAFDSLLGPGEEDTATQLKRTPIKPGGVHLSKAQFTSLLNKKINSDITPQKRKSLTLLQSDNVFVAPSTKQMKAGKPPVVK